MGSIYKIFLTNQDLALKEAISTVKNYWHIMQACHPSANSEKLFKHHSEISFS